MIQSSDSNTPIVRKEYTKNTIACRASYTPKNAEQFRGVFDKMLLTQQNQEIHCDSVGFKAATLYIKAQDALKWLAENDIADKDRYAILRTRIAIRKQEDRIILYFKSCIANIIQSAAASVRLGKEWKEELLEWLKNAQDGDIWEKKGVSLEPDDREWITNLAAGLDGSPELELGDAMIRMMR